MSPRGYQVSRAAKPSSADTLAAETDLVDIHGIPKCRSCGLSLDITKTSGANGHPRTWGRCPMPSAPECHGEQSISSSKDWRALGLVPRTSEIYSAVYGQIQPAERAHEQMRALFGVGGKTLRERIRRIGRPAQQLRANAALLLQWVIVMARQGWLGNRPERVQPEVVPTGHFFKKVIRARRLASLFGGTANARGALAPERTAAEIDPRPARGPMAPAARRRYGPDSPVVTAL